jgi:hypothetical protein
LASSSSQKDSKGIGKSAKDVKLPSAAPTGAVAIIDNHVATRLAVAESIRAMGVDLALTIDSDNNDSSAPLDLLDLVLAHGAVDYSGEVRAVMLTAGRALVDAYGSSLCGPMLALLEGILQRKPSSKSQEDLTAYDYR